eukprot:9468610-Pyramimonas_sp.AAC.1
MSGEFWESPDLAQCAATSRKRGDPEASCWTPPPLSPLVGFFPSPAVEPSTVFRGPVGNPTDDPSGAARM